MSLLNDHIKPFGITLIRYLRLRTKRIVRWMMRSWWHLGISAVVIIALVLTIHNLGKTDRAPEQAAQAEASTAADEDLTFREVEALPLGAQQEATDTEEPQVSPSSASAEAIPSPQKPSPDRKKADSTAEAFLTAYLSRGDDEQWQDWTGDLTSSELAAFLDSAKTPLDGRGDTHVNKVQIGDKPFTGAPKDTPVRWSRPASATVQTQRGQDMKINFELTLMKGKHGWEVTDAVQRGWASVGQEG